MGFCMKVKVKQYGQPWKVGSFQCQSSGKEADSQETEPGRAWRVGRSSIHTCFCPDLAVFAVDMEVGWCGRSGVPHLGAAWRLGMRTLQWGKKF
jgi:hypothetical protein